MILLFWSDLPPNSYALRRRLREPEPSLNEDYFWMLFV